MNVPAAAAHEILLVGTPNAGKSTLFGALTGAFAGVGNYPGTTVTVQRSRVDWGGREVWVSDLPGTVSLAARSPEEVVTLAVLLEAAQDPARTPLVVFVADAPRLGRSLYLLTQVLELGLPTVVALNLVDEARAAGVEIDHLALERLLGVPVVPTVARSGVGVSPLRAVLQQTTPVAAAVPAIAWPDPVLDAVAVVTKGWLAAGTPLGSWGGGVARWALLSDDDAIEAAGLATGPVDAARRAAEAVDLDAALIGARYAWIDARLPSLLGEGLSRDSTPAWSRQLDRVLLHPVGGSIAFAAVMSMVFATLFWWSDPLVGLVEDGFAWLGATLDSGLIAAGAVGPSGEILRGLLVDGLIGGVGAVLVFIPQIALLFTFLGVLEDSGYLARAAHIMDRVLRAAGLPGAAFVPLLSGYACAVPAILATRTMPRFRDRLLTMMVIPLTSCSARLPVYALLVGALFPATVTSLGLPLRPLVLLGLYAFSAVLSVLAAIVLGRVLLPASVDAVVLELPPYRVPGMRMVLRGAYERTADFVREAGRIILVATLVLWALLSFPRFTPEQILPPDVMADAVAQGIDPEEAMVPYAMRESYAGQLGRALEPVIAPLGFDWKIGVGLVGSFAAREVFVATMGVVYGIEDATEETVGLREAIRDDRRPDGTRVFTPLVGASLLVFFAIAMQCLSTLAVLRKETGGWRWPAAITVGLTALAWLSSFLVYQGGLLLGFG